MIKLSVFYPYQENARFDHDYYLNSHLPLLKKLMGDACLKYEVDKGLNGGAPGSKPVYFAMCHVYCESLEAFQTSFGPHAEVVTKDVANYTDLTPVMQISEVRT